ncbi:MAG: SPOR domain-containing protein [Pseudomonadota bacterium]|nr:SPOR domain-containing protein [Pseudomonadota bacterium]
MIMRLTPPILSRLVIALLFGLTSLPNLAGDLEVGITAYQQQDYQAALNAWNRGAQQGDADAEYNLGQLYRLGQGVKISYPAAQSYYLKAAKKNHPLAQLNLGTMYYSGKLGPDQEENAFSWLQKAAENDNAPAQWMTGIMLFNGQGVSQDSIAAYSWLTLASEQQHPQAIHDQTKLKTALSAKQLDLADSLTNAFRQKKAANSAIQQQEKDAFYWLQKAAEKGDAHAQWMIGDMLCNGQGVAQDKVTAYSWLTLASEQLHPQASLKISQLKSKLSAEQLSLADSLTTAFKQQHKVNTLIPQKHVVNKLEFRVQIGAFKHKQQAAMVLIELTEKFPKLLSQQISTITQPEHNSTKPEFYRLQLGAFNNKNDASKLCQQLKNNKQSCFVVKTADQH